MNECRLKALVPPLTHVANDLRAGDLAVILQSFGRMQVCCPELKSRWQSVKHYPGNMGTEKKHRTFFNINFLAPTQNPHIGPSENSLCASFPGKERKKGTHTNFFGGGGPKRAIFGHKKFIVMCFFLPFKHPNHGPIQI